MQTESYARRQSREGLFCGWCQAALFLILLLTPPAGAAGIFDPGGGEIHITSERMVMQTDEHVVEFIGNVHATQTDTTVASDRLKVFYKPGSNPGTGSAGLSEDAVRRVVAEGNVTIDFQDKRAVCEKAVYTTIDALLKLTGSPARLESLDSVITGREITLNQKTGEVIINGTDDSRVEAVFQSGSKPSGPQAGPEPGSQTQQ